MTMNRFNNISNTELQNLIENWIKSERDRNLMKRRLLPSVGVKETLMRTLVSSLLRITS